MSRQPTVELTEPLPFLKLVAQLRGDVDAGQAGVHVPTSSCHAQAREVDAQRKIRRRPPIDAHSSRTTPAAGPDSGLSLCRNTVVFAALIVYEPHADDVGAEGAFVARGVADIGVKGQSLDAEK